MNRSELLKTLGTALPASALLTVEPEIQKSDVIVIHTNDELCHEERQVLLAAIRQIFGDDQPTVLVFENGLTLNVERNVARVQIPKETCMKSALLLISPALLVDLFKEGPARTFDVTTHALPADAKFVDVRYINSRGEIALEVASESFNERPPKAAPPVLPPPVCSVVTEDELLARAALKSGFMSTNDIRAREESEVPRAPEDIETERT